MKKHYSFMLIAVAAVAFASCEKEIDNLNQPVLEPKNEEVEMITITVNPTIEMTKSTLNSDHSKIVWSAYDKIRVYNNVNTSSSEITYSDGDDPITVSVPAGTTEIYSQYPSKTNTEGPSKVLLSISNEQTQKNPGELAGRYYPMVAKGTVSGTSANMVFYPVAGALALNIYNSALVGTENVKSVTAVPYTTAYVGDQTNTNITGADVSYSTPESSLPICVTLTNALSIGSSKPSNTKTYEGQIYVCMARKSYTGIKFIIETDKNFYTKDASAATFDLTTNDFIPVNINLATCMTMAESYFELYSGSISEGDYIVYYNGKVLKAGIDNSRFMYDSKSPVASTITTSDPLIVWHIAASGTYWTLFNEVKQTYAASTGAANKGQLLYDGTDDKSLWTFSGTTTYEAVNKKNAANSVNANLRNNGTSGWATYSTSTGGAFSLYKLDTKTLSSIALSGSYKTDFYVDDSFVHDGLVVTATFSDLSNRDVTSDAVFSSPDISTTGVKTVTVSYTFRGVEKSESYDITVSPRPTFTVTFADDSSTLTEASVGSGVVLPSRSNSSPWSFAGWATSDIASETTTAPAAIYTAGSTYHPASNCTLYPVYTKAGPTTTTWTKISDLSTVTAGTYALLTTDGHAFNGTISKGHGQVTSSAFSFEDNIATSAPSGTCELTLSSSGAGYTMYNSSNGYLYSKEAKSGSLAWAADTETADNVWKYYDSNWCYDATYFRSSSNSSFRTYSSSSYGDVMVMARKGTTSLTYYISDPA